MATAKQMKELSSVESKTKGCETCTGGELTEARVYCLECEQRLCQACEEDHNKSKVTCRHRTLELGSATSVIETLSNVVPSGSSCYKHVGEQMRIYCLECKVSACMMCYIESHDSHKISYLGKVADNFRKQMKVDVDNLIAKAVDKCREMFKKLDEEKNDFTEQVAKTGMEISKKAEKLKKMIDVHEEKLMNELSSMKQKRITEIESLREKIHRQFLLVENYKKYVDKVREKGTFSDIVRAASDLHDRADEMLMIDVSECTQDDLGHADVTFTSSNVVIDDVNKTLGQLRLNTGKTAVKSSAATGREVMSSLRRGDVTAMTSVGDDVFVVRWGGKHVEVYDAETLSLQRKITGLRLGYSYGLAACAHNRCLYVSDYPHDSVHAVDFLGGNAVTWCAAGRPAGLSVNKAHNLVVACCTANMLQEYTTYGTLVREIRLESPWQAIQLSGGDYVVSQNTSPPVVSVVGVDGQVVRSYCQSQASDDGRVNAPTNLVVTKNDGILVVDQDNSRIMSVNSSLNSVRQLQVLSADDELQEPHGLCLNESRRRLYVSEGSGRVMAFDGIF